MTMLRRARMAQGLSIKEVAIELGVSIGAVSQWELGVCLPKPKRLKRLSELLKIPIDDIISQKKAG